jgi:hypothetical protein
MFGCSAETQRVCSTGEESDAVAYAVEYWASRGEVVMVSDSDCTIRTRVTEEPCPGEQWGDANAMFCGLELLGPVLPSHTFQAELRFRTERWDLMPKHKTYGYVVRNYTATHELGHTWRRKHSKTGVMAESLPATHSECAQVLAAE